MKNRSLTLVLMVVLVSAVSSGCVSHQIIGEWEPSAVHSEVLENAPVRPMIDPDRPYSVLMLHGWRDWHEQINDALAERTPGDGGHQVPLHVRVYADPDSFEQSPNVPLLVVTMLTAGIIPSIYSSRYEHVLELENGNGQINQIRAPARDRRVTSIIAGIVPGNTESLGPGGNEKARAALVDYLGSRMVDKLRADREHLRAQTQTGDRESYERYLAEHPDSTMYNAALATLASFAPRFRDQALVWHQRRMREFAGYEDALEPDTRLWLIGPEGYSALELKHALEQGVPESVLINRLRPHYRTYLEAAFRDHEDLGARTGDLHISRPDVVRLRDTNQPLPPLFLSQQERDVLVSGGLPRALADTLGRVPRPGEAPPYAGIQVPMEYVLIEDTSGHYMNPWTRDDVLAEWVNQALNVQTGQAVGGALGATAGAAVGGQLLRNVPGGQFIGGMAGSQLGQSAGRSVALEQIGGMAFLRETSDTSFASLEDMARYLKAHYGNDPNFADAINAADRIYPGLKDAL